MPFVGGLLVLFGISLFVGVVILAVGIGAAITMQGISGGWFVVAAILSW
jgi:hypothetical protein